MRADGVEVAQNGDAPLVVLLVHVAEDALHHELRLAIRMLNALHITASSHDNMTGRRVLIKRAHGIAVNRAGGREHYR